MASFLTQINEDICRKKKKRNNATVNPLPAYTGGGESQCWKGQWVKLTEIYQLVTCLDN